jgi:hypothetical protein
LSEKTHLVKITRTGWESVLGAGTLDQCTAQAAALNEQYQTDEYYVEAFDPEKVWKMPTRAELRKFIKNFQTDLTRLEEVR